MDYSRNFGNSKLFNKIMGEYELNFKSQSNKCTFDESLYIYINIYIYIYIYI